MNPSDEDLEAITHRLNQSQRIVTAAADVSEHNTDQEADQFASYVADPLVGKKLDGGRYHILSVLGRGGMSVVYKARQELVDRPVAIKTLTCQLLGDPVVLKRFQREIRALSKLSHPNIVSAFDCVVDNSGQPYFIMDYLDGESLAEVICDEGMLAQDRVRRIFLQVCHAVSHAHHLQVLHRDLKPANIMLVNVGTPDELVKVVDFGLAKLSEDAQKLTVTGEVWGSPSYMSPEQVYGKSNDSRSDIYSVGCVMFEALAGRPPFQGATPIDTVMMQVNASPPTFAAVDPKLSIHPALEAIVLTCLQKNPDERFQSMVDVATALQDLDLKSPAAIKIPAAKPQPSTMPAPPAQAATGTAGANTVEVPQPGRPQSTIGRAAPGAVVAGATTPKPAPANGGTPINQMGGNSASAIRNAGTPSQLAGGAPALQVVRPSSAMRSGASQNNQRMLISAVLIFAGILGLSGLAATFFFLGSREGSAPAKPAAQPVNPNPAPPGTVLVTPSATTVPTTGASVAPTGTSVLTTGASRVPTGTSVPTTGATVVPPSGSHATAVKPTALPGQTAATTSGETHHGQEVKPSHDHAGAKPPVVAHAKTTQPRKPKHKHTSSDGDVGGNYVPPPVNDADRWYGIEKSWRH